MIMPDSPTLAVMASLSTSQPMSKIKERKVTLNVERFSTVNGYNKCLYIISQFSLENNTYPQAAIIGAYTIYCKLFFI
jgi:hypothetical protein